MSHPQNTFVAEVEATVGKTGKIEALGRTYWSPAMIRYAGWDVSVRVPKEEHGAVQVWSGTHFLASADLIADVGFDQLGAARKAFAQPTEVAHRVRDERRSLVVRRRAELLVQLLDQTIENRGFVKFAIGNMLPVNALQRFRSFFIEVRKVVFDNHLCSDRERTERADTRLQLAERIFELSDAVYKDHPDLPSMMAMREDAERDVAEEANRPANAGHRLSETSK